MIRSLAAALGIVVSGLSTAHAAAPPIDAFARRPAIRNLNISPDGSKLAYIAGNGDFSVAMVAPRDRPGAAKPVMSSDPGKFDLSWCTWANDNRLLCSLQGIEASGSLLYVVTRLAAVNADGSQMRMLIRNQNAQNGQLQDRILDWTPDNPDSVLIEMDDERYGCVEVFELDVDSGRRTRRIRQHCPITTFVADASGDLRFGIGGSRPGSAPSYWARSGRGDDWRELTKTQTLRNGSLRTRAAAAGPNSVYVIGPYEGRSALWELDLADQQEPRLVFSHPRVDAGMLLFTAHGRVAGMRYDLDRPTIYYPDERLRALMRNVDQSRPDSVNVVIDHSRDEQLYVIHSYSDVDAGTYLLLDRKTNRITTLSKQFPALDPAQLGRMRSISYKAADGTEIPGYLTAPPGARAEEKLPLIVMPHGGPLARDSWEYDMVRAFLVSRGYAVLQMNFRGSLGYGEQWQTAARQDWGGLTYSDITDGVRWATAQGIADPARICIVGRSFGGYAALLGAVRNPDLYKCSVSIGGVSDLKQMVDDRWWFSRERLPPEKMGVDSDKLRRDSPLLQADKMKIPVLLVHGDADHWVNATHSQRMAVALQRADKPHRAVIIAGGTGELERASDRRTLLTELEKFVLENLGPGTPGS